MPSPAEFFRVRNFEKFQHYHDRRPPWIKLYRDLWDDPRFFDLSPTDRYVLIGLFVIASQHDNKVPVCDKWLRAQLLMTSPIHLKTFIDTGWLELVEQDASNTLAASSSLADCYPSRARGETETEIQNTKAETEKNADPRRGPFTEFAFKTFAERYGELIPDVSDFSALKVFLSRTHADLAEIERRWVVFLNSDNPFHREQGHPLRFFCGNYNAFHGVNGNGSKRESNNERIQRKNREKLAQTNQGFFGANGDGSQS